MNVFTEAASDPYTDVPADELAAAEKCYLGRSDQPLRVHVCCCYRAKGHPGQHTCGWYTHHPANERCNPWPK